MQSLKTKKAALEAFHCAENYSQALMNEKMVPPRYRSLASVYLSTIRLDQNPKQLRTYSFKDY